MPIENCSVPERIVWRFDAEPLDPATASGKANPFTNIGGDITDLLHMCGDRPSAA
jgi:hypothetical protein